MTGDPAAWNPTSRFSGLADVYARCRPDYPSSAIDFILRHCGLKPGSLVVDVGCGTGISTRQLAARGVRVIGIEPNADMRKQADSFSRDPQGSAPEYRDGTAEATGIDDSSADLVLAAQAFHWFRPEPTLREFHRILKPGGWVALMWNERDETDPFTKAFGDVIRTARDAAAVEAPRPRSGDVLFTSPLFTQAERQIFPHEQMMDEEGMLGRAFSMSFSPKGEEEAAKFAAKLREVFERFQQEGRVVLQYETSVTVASSLHHDLSDIKRTDEWIDCHNLYAMITLLPGYDRKWRLFAVASCRCLTGLEMESSCWNALPIAEQYADGLCSREEVIAGYHQIDQLLLHSTIAIKYHLYHPAVAMRETLSFERPHPTSFSESSSFWLQADEVAWAVANSLTVSKGKTPISPEWYEYSELERSRLCNIVRDIFGNPFRPITLDPAWLTWNDATIPRLAQRIYDERRFDDLPILADALEEAGCTSGEILGHCRGPGPHVRGCWVVDLILGKE